MRECKRDFSPTIVRCIRIGLTAFMIYKVYNETGIWTALLLAGIGLYMELNVIKKK